MKNVAGQLMTSRFRVLAALLAVALAVGCSEKATVTIREHIEPTKPFPAEQIKIAVSPFPADMSDDARQPGGTLFDQSAPAAEVFESYLSDIVKRDGLNVIIVDRATLDIQMMEHDIGISELVLRDDEDRELPKMLGVDVILTTKCLVTQVVSEVEKESVSLGGVLGQVLPGGRRKVTSTRKGYRLQLHVDGMFRLTWLGSAEAIHSDSIVRTDSDSTMPSSFLGGDKSLADLKPPESMVNRLLQSMAEEFFLPMVGGERVVAQVEVRASNNPSCIHGIRQLRGEYWAEALESFEEAIQEATQEHSEDDRALFGAGVASEMLRRYEDALDYYRRAEVVDDEDTYRAGMNRMKLKLDR